MTTLMDRVHFMRPSDTMKVYVSGPMRGYPNFNFEQFNEVASTLRAAGYEVVNPAESFGGDQSLDFHTYMRRDISDILDCDALITLPGWHDSEGANIEVTVARAIGIPVWDLEAFMSPATPAYDLAERPQETILEEANRLIHGARQKSYGHPLDDFSRTAKMWSALFGVDVTPEQVALGMMCVKISRLVQTPDHRDSIVDAAGYAGTYEMVVQERARLAAVGQATTVAPSDVEHHFA